MSDDLLKIITMLAAPLVAFLSLIIWMAIMMTRDRSLTVNLKFIGLSLSVAARPCSEERRGADLCSATSQTEDTNVPK